LSVPQNKDELLKAIETTFSKLLADLKAVPESEAFALSMDGHAKSTQMSVANLVAYLIGWNELVLKWLDHDRAGQHTDFPETGFKWNELAVWRRNSMPIMKASTILPCSTGWNRPSVVS